MVDKEVIPLFTREPLIYSEFPLRHKDVPTDAVPKALYLKRFGNDAFQIACLNNPGWNISDLP